MVYLYDRNKIKRIMNIGVLIILVFNSAFCIAQQGNINIKVSSIKDMKGNIYAYLYSSKDGFPVEPSKADKFKTVKVDAQTVTITFNNIKYGYYAVSVYHDEDSNGKMKIGRASCRERV